MYYEETKIIVVLITLDYVCITGLLVRQEIFYHVMPVEGYGKIWPKLAYLVNNYFHCELEVQRPKARL